MPIGNSEVADILKKVADLLDIQGANPFRVRAYRNAARTVSSLPRNVSDMVGSSKDLSQLAGIGKDLAAKIKEIVDTGSLKQLEKIEEKTPAELNRLMRIDTLGPKRIKRLYQELDVRNLSDLKKAAEKNKIRKIKGFGPKTEARILENIHQAERREKRITLLESEQQAFPLVAYLKKTRGLKEITVAGSYRRRKETIGDLDILVTCKKGTKMMDRFVSYDEVDKVVSKGKTRSTVLLRSGLQVDLRVLPQVSYGAALHYFTGSKRHNIAIRKIAGKKRFKINEYGVYRGDQRVAGRTEQEVFEKVDLPYIEPELRENRGEIEAAREGELPVLLELKDLRGDLHSHTKATDGHNTLREMAEAAKERGYEYLAVTDHSQRVTMARGFDAAALKEQITMIDRLNEKLDGILLLKGIEVDILKDGSLDLPDEILKEVDLTVCSIHYNQNLSEKEQTERIIRAMDNPYFNILGHPTGRMINERKPMAVNLEKVMEAAVERGCFMELNAHPYRLDLSDQHCRMAREMDLKVAVSTDAHSVTDLDFIRFGVDQARRGWLRSDDVLNTRSWPELKQLLEKK